jgi:hypothetical protein
MEIQVVSETCCNGVSAGSKIDCGLKKEKTQGTRRRTQGKINALCLLF